MINAPASLRSDLLDAFRRNQWMLSIGITGGFLRNTHLIQERWLEAHPGLGTVVAEPPLARPRDRKRLLEHELEQLVVEAKRLGLTMTDLVDGIAIHWSKLDKDQEVANQSWSKLTTSGSGSAILKRLKA